MAGLGPSKKPFVALMIFVQTRDRTRGATRWLTGKSEENVRRLRRRTCTRRDVMSNARQTENDGQRTSDVVSVVTWLACLTRSREVSPGIGTEKSSRKSDLANNKFEMLNIPIATPFISGKEQLPFDNMMSPTKSPKARDEPLIGIAARVNDDEEISINRKALLTSQSDAVNNKDAHETADTGSSSIERLENELRRARVVYESAYAKQVMLQTEDTTSSSTAAADDTNITNNQDIEQCVETTNNMHKEMELAKKEMLEASLRAEDFLADLQQLQDDCEDKAGITEQELDMISSPTGVAGLNIHAKQDTSTVSLDMKSLLRDIKDLKLHVKAAKEEVAELRSSINFQSDTSNQEKQVNKTHRRVHSTSTSQTVPTEVECTIDNTSNSYQPNHEDMWHQTYVDQHLRISKGFNDTSREFDANWWKGSIDNNDEGICGSEPCVFGGLVKMLKRRDVNSRRDILT